MGGTQTGKKKHRPTLKSWKKARKASNSVIMPPIPPTRSSRPNTDEVRTTNKAQATGAATNTKNHAAVIRDVQRKDLNRAQYCDPNTVFAPSAMRQYSWLKQQRSAVGQTNATGTNSMSASGSTNR
ncbi:hypothetical protein FVEN_g5139 [Fusarium venenatum]|uniref:Uncharacterized protein n=1 Tax=Fusarium venenatum TaxID=56646 RepID=A0A2L2THU3_9HYPO|nr:uncharacterized protein FVRRES_07042 [Fusarium venenatum]KAG8357070.1 hypothetical protein FVEN_g5139 [Fusarium venenatum]CEI62606.1 unnamed protein product [Fusarium venenatum]